MKLWQSVICHNKAYLLIAAIIAFILSFAVTLSLNSEKVFADYEDAKVIECGKDYTVTVPAKTESGKIYYRFKDKREKETSTYFCIYDYMVTAFYVSGDGKVDIEHWFTDGGVESNNILSGICKSNPSVDTATDLLGCYDNMDDLFVFVNESESPVTLRFRVDPILASKIEKKTQNTGAKPGTTAKVNGATVKVVKNVSSSAPGCVIYTAAPNKSSVTVPAEVTINGTDFKVTQVGTKAFKGKKIKKVTLGSNILTIKAKAFKGSNVTKVIIKTKLLRKTKIKMCLKGSKVKTVQIKVGNKKTNKKYVKTYKKIFTKKIVGAKVKIK